MTTKKYLGMALATGLVYMLVKPKKNNNDISDTSNDISVANQSNENMSPSCVHFHLFPYRDNSSVGWHRLCEIDSIAASGAFYICLSGYYNHGQIPGINAQIEWLYTNTGTINIQSQSEYTQTLRIVKDINTNKAFLDCYFAADGAISLIVVGYCKINYYDNAPLVK